MVKCMKFIVYGRILLKHPIAIFGENIQQEPVDAIISDNEGCIVAEYFDDSLSTYNRKHIQESTVLRRIYDDVQADMYERGTVLLMYSLDLFSRQDSDYMLHYYTNLRKKGVVIWMYIGGLRKLDSKCAMVEAFGEFKRAHSESLIKQQRVKDVWAIKYDRMRQGEAVKLSSKPFWIDFKESPNRYEANHHAKTVQRIFDMYITGYAVSQIAAVLNNENIPCYSKSKSRQQADIWSRKQVQYTLKNGAVYGCFIGKRNNIIINDVYPEIVLRKCFDVAQAIIKTRKGKQSSQNANLFNDLLKCGYCGGGLARNYTDNRCSKHEIRRYYNYGCSSDERCQISSKISAKVFDSVVLRFLQDLDWSFMEDRRPTSEAIIANKRNEITAHSKRFNALTMGLITTALDEIQRLDLKTISEVRDRYTLSADQLLTTDNDTRLKVNKTLSVLIDKIEVFTSGVIKEGIDYKQLRKEKILRCAKIYFNKWEDEKQSFRIVYIDDRTTT